MNPKDTPDLEEQKQLRQLRYKIQMVVNKLSPGSAARRKEEAIEQLVQIFRSAK